MDSFAQGSVVLQLISKSVSILYTCCKVLEPSPSDTSSYSHCIAFQSLILPAPLSPHPAQSSHPIGCYQPQCSARVPSAPGVLPQDMPVSSLWDPAPLHTHNWSSCTGPLHIQISGNRCFWFVYLFVQFYDLAVIALVRVLHVSQVVSDLKPSEMIHRRKGSVENHHKS